jgi:hypothetical protein
LAYFFELDSACNRIGCAASLAFLVVSEGGIFLKSIEAGSFAGTTDGVA